MKFKSSYLILILSILMFSVATHASDIPAVSHEELVTGYINELGLIENEIFALAELVNSNQFKSTFNRGSEFLNNKLDTLLNSMSTYDASLPSKSSERRDIALLLSAANLMRASLLELGQISDNPSDIEITLVLENYFKYRGAAKNSLDAVRGLLS